MKNTIRTNIFSKIKNNNENKIFLREALTHIPHIIGLVDKNKLSPTYGCFDRNFWHYKTIDFPTGMAQLGILALAYVYKYPFDESVTNKWYKNPRIKELVIAGMKYMPKCSHNDGTTDEFYPYERALGATAFSLIAASEAYIVMNLDEPEIVSFFKKRADWVIENAEPSTIANHLAGAALALANIYLITKEKKYLAGAKKKMQETLAWKNKEGWFQEYDGCDVGYLTFTIDYIVKYYHKTKDKSVIETLNEAINFCSYFVHPDGSFAGEYGSRNTAHFLPAGFELIAKDIPLARSILNKYRTCFEDNKHEHMNDEKYLFYNVNNYIQTYLYTDKKSVMIRDDKLLPKLPCEDKDFQKYFSQAQLHVIKKNNRYIVLSIAKGGVMKIFDDKRLIYSFTGLIGKNKSGKVFTTQLYGGIKKFDINKDHIIINGNFQRAFFKLQTTENFFILRSIMLTLGRSWKIGSFIKHVLVKKLITKKKIIDKEYLMDIHFGKDGIVINIAINNHDDFFTELYETSDLALIQVPTSRYYQEVNMMEWKNISCRNKKSINIQRTISTH
ncbi:MAG: hypothetical protein ACP5NV_03410 [Candidatus Woesearchaeota archaeon]